MDSTLEITRSTRPGCPRITAWPALTVPCPVCVFVYVCTVSATALAACKTYLYIIFCAAECMQVSLSRDFRFTSEKRWGITSSVWQIYVVVQLCFLAHLHILQFHTCRTGWGRRKHVQIGLIWSCTPYWPSPLGVASDSAIPEWNLFIWALTARVTRNYVSLILLNH